MSDRSKNRYRILVPGSLVAIAVCAPASTTWPVIRQIHMSQSYTIRGDSDTPLTAKIATPDGTTVYKLECHNGNHEDESVINFSGDFQCVLYSVEGNRRTSWNLLATDDPDEQRSDFLNRGRMTANQIRGQCGMIPEYGRVRHFRLRGISIRVEFKSLYWRSPSDRKEPQLVGFTFVLDVSPDAGVTSATAEKIGAPWPEPPCR